MFECRLRNQTIEVILPSVERNTNSNKETNDANCNPTKNIHNHGLERRTHENIPAGVLYGRGYHSVLPHHLQEREAPHGADRSGSTNVPGYFGLQQGRKMRGGARKGAGRKPGPKGPKGSVTLWLPDDVGRFLETFGNERSNHVDKMVRKNAAFRAWLKEQDSK